MEAIKTVEAKVNCRQVTGWSGRGDTNRRSVRRAGSGDHPAYAAVDLLILYSMFSMKWACIGAAECSNGAGGRHPGGCISRTEFQLSSGVGFLVLFGVSVQTGVILVEYINQLRARGYPTFEAVRDGAIQRFRPILMTMLVASLGLLPAATARNRLEFAASLSQS
jgi:cobalt-zinc-cadmium resistance protein CzcA